MSDEEELKPTEAAEELDESAAPDAAEDAADNASEEGAREERDLEGLRPIVEALVFASEEPITVERLAKILDEPEKKVIRECLHALRDEYTEQGRGFTLEEVGGAFQLRTRADFAPWVRRLKDVKPQKFSAAALETLAIVAYRQPVLRQEIEDVRGVDVGAVLKTLLDRRLVKVLGRKDVPGKPLLYGTTREFLSVFNLKNLSELPSLRDLKELEQESASQIEMLFPERGSMGDLEELPTDEASLAEDAEGGDDLSDAAPESESTETTEADAGALAEAYAAGAQFTDADEPAPTDEPHADVEAYAPDVLESFKKLADTGRVEFLDETYYHSLSFLHSKEEFKEQVRMHTAKMQELFGITPTVFRNTELVYNNELAKFVEGLGYKAILAEGHERILGWKNPNFVYRPKGCENIKLLLKNYKLSDDIAFRFSQQSWKEWPLTTEKFSQWVNAINGNGVTLNLFMDYETFGEHQWADTGIFDFMRQLPVEVLKNPDNGFVTPSALVEKHDAMDEVDCHHLMSWADVERDLSAWLGNKMQDSSIARLYALEQAVKKANDPPLLEAWRRLTTSDHLYYMCTKWFNDGDVHKYFNPYDSPYDSFINFMNILNDVMLRLRERNAKDLLTSHTQGEIQKEVNEGAKEEIV